MIKFKPMKYITHILIFGFLLTFSAGNAQDANEIFEDNVEQPPLNPVLSQVTYDGKVVPSVETIQSDIFDMNVFYSDYSTVTGVKSFNGIVSLDRPGTLSLEGDNESVLITYALPDKVSLDQEFKLENGTVEVINFSDPGGSLKEIVISEKESVEVAFFWKTQQEPVQFESRYGISFLQQKPDEDVKEGFTPVSLLINAGNQEIEIRAGDSGSFSHKGSDYTCYVMESTLNTTQDRGGCTSGGYILRAYIIKNR